MNQYQSLALTATVYLVEFESGKTYVDVTNFGQTPEEHIASLIKTLPDVYQLYELYNASSRYGGLRVSISNLGKELNIADAVPKVLNALYKAAFIRALHTEAYDISVISALKAPLPKRALITAKYEAVYKLRSFMPYGLNSHNNPAYFLNSENEGYITGMRGVIERTFAQDCEKRSRLFKNVEVQHQMANRLVGMAVTAMHFKGLSPKQFSPLVQFIPVDEYLAMSIIERDFASACLIAAPDIFCGYKDVSADYDIEPGVSISSIQRNGPNAASVQVSRNDFANYIPWRLWSSASAVQNHLFGYPKQGVQSAVSKCANGESYTAYGSVWRWLPAGSLTGGRLW